ncbi:ABC transporter B family member 5, putative [Plasmodium berghei]|uniref:ABC transporter B family member 5, putative n=2 Tax=Plasmodium berghei TaxID=5821 RepID=A0A509ARD8_PLABA|nr:ABC transporter B family member 5, putative [Plasmodium berghei ANKA]CXJ02455.1 ABC transporter B family member 5, putative [Plasmodium berghei]SCL98306.1 ABC transporter B family member 5, putative [Plasmodium berghei]SCM16806.1 ABC transporter B family member 5, putative [Plasmodium berghei]SCM18604.1 ABC transporter B family member 5, putative [Plasmodium berghei]SCN28039.1 ABC transporter B family member 5, putative [Plasmodium berghei]|eukprot:XP_034423690.1 ABC transporter B family member 5, putative [Plasmodium berghei ANKA]
MGNNLCKLKKTNLFIIKFLSDVYKNAYKNICSNIFVSTLGNGVSKFFSDFMNKCSLLKIWGKHNDINDFNNNKSFSQKNDNYLFRALYEMTNYEKTLLSISLVFLGINAITNLNYPKIMGECLEGENFKFCRPNVIVKILQKLNILEKFKLNSNKSLSAILYFLPYFICGGIASYFRIYFTNKCIKKIEYRLKKQVHNKIISETDENFKKYKSNDYLVNCLFNEIQFSSKELITSITQMLRYINSIVGGIMSMCLISPYLTKFCIFIVPTYGFCILIILKKLKKIKIEINNFEEKQMERFSDSLQKKNIITIFGNEYYENQHFSKIINLTEKEHQKYINSESMFYSFLNIGTNLVICTILSFGKIELNNNRITHGQLVSFIAYSSMLGLGIVGILKLKKDVNLLKLSIKKIYDILDFSPQINNNTTSFNNQLSNKTINSVCDKIDDISLSNINLNNIIQLENSIQNDDIVEKNNIICEQIQGSIKFENINFTYNKFDQDKKLILKNINFEIKKNEKIAIIGKSGSGKSTIWKLLTREYEYEGNIYIDNFNIKNFDKTYLKKSILSITEQECCILNRSLYENIVYALLPTKVSDPKGTKYLLLENIGDLGRLDNELKANISNNTNNANNKNHYDKLNNCTDKFTTIENKLNEKNFINNKLEDIQNYNYMLLEKYGDKINTINSTIDILCKELNLNDFINSMPQNILTNVNNNSMSSGQKQRISIIRSLMKNSYIYIFDEITSFLDESNIDKVYNLIHTLIPDKTIIYITHSLKHLKEMDKIIIIDQGTISAIGTYQELNNHPLFLEIFSL